MKKLYSNPVMNYISMEDELHCGDWLSSSGDVSVEKLDSIKFTDLKKA